MQQVQIQLEILVSDWSKGFCSLWTDWRFSFVLLHVFKLRQFDKTVTVFIKAQISSAGVCREGGCFYFDCICTGVTSPLIVWLTEPKVLHVWVCVYKCEL